MRINLVCTLHTDANKPRLLERNRHASGVLFKVTQAVTGTGFAQFEPMFEKFHCGAMGAVDCLEYWRVELEESN